MESPEQVGSQLPNNLSAVLRNPYGIALVICLTLSVVLGVLAYYLYTRTQSAEEHLAELSEQVTELTLSVERATEAAAAARSASTQAEELAHLAARGKAIAEASQRASELRAQQAEAEAERERQAAAQSRKELADLRRQREEDWREVRRVYHIQS